MPNISLLMLPRNSALRGTAMVRRALLRGGPRAFSSMSSEQQAKAVENLCSQGPFSWETVDGARPAIKKQFNFNDFSQAWSFMSRAALLAEKMDHHPEWFNVFSVDVTLTTHDSQSISEKDIRMAEAMDEFAQELLRTRKEEPAAGGGGGGPDMVTQH